MREQRSVFFLSDQTGITAEGLGNALLTQFQSIDFVQQTIPFISSEERAQDAVDRINTQYLKMGVRPLVFTTVIDDQLRAIIKRCDALVMDFVESFVGPMEEELHQASSHVVGKSHGEPYSSRYQARIDAMNYALTYDDGQTTKHYAKADVILVGISRTGKTPTCLYLALNYGIFAANFPINDDDIADGHLPNSVQPFLDKLVALTIDPPRLQQIRAERRPNSRYASLAQCQFEARAAERLYQMKRLPTFNSTSMSIEELATRIVHERKLPRRFY